jgi:hypothetical protein
LFLVYALVDPRDNQFFYIGKGVKDRPKSHLNETYENTGNKRKWCKIQSIRNDGFEPLVHIIRDNFINEQDAYNFEAEQIKKYGRKDLDEGGTLTNLCIDNRPPSPLGRIVSPETKFKHSAQQIGSLNHRFGKHWSEEDKQSRREFNIENNIKPPVRDKPHSEATKEKMRQSALGVKKSEEHCKNIGLSKAGEKHPNWGKTTPKDRKEKIRAANIIAKQRTYILTNGINEYKLTSSSITEFCKVHNISRDMLFRERNRGLTYKGWTLIETTPPKIKS